MNVDVRVIPHANQRYQTVGDWWVDPPNRLDHKRDATLHIRVSKMGKDSYEQLVAHHEYTEALLCLTAGIKQEDVDAFDKAYENAREERNVIAPCGCPMTDDSEPGDDEHAPYYKQHQIATGFERILAAELGVSWADYEQAVQSCGT